MKLSTSHKEWREFEKLIARIESDARDRGAQVRSPDRIRCKITGRSREVDASIRVQVGGKARLVTIECRKRAKGQDITWIEQLATKKSSIGADQTIAVSSSGFSKSAQIAAKKFGITLRTFSELSIEDIDALIRLDFVLFWHRAAAIARVGITQFKSIKWEFPDPSNVNFILPDDLDAFSHIFTNLDTGETWSLNDLWHQLQDATDPFEKVEKARPPVMRTAVFPYPGNVSLETPDGLVTLGNVILTMGLWIKAEQIRLEDAVKVEYATSGRIPIQRVEFISECDKGQKRAISIQKNEGNVGFPEVRSGYQTLKCKPE